MAMKTGQYIRTLAEFVTGEIEMPDFKQLVEERLFELRQSPEMTEEKNVLSTIELLLHENEEGMRGEDEVYAKAQFILDDIILNRMPSDPNFVSSTPPNLPYRLLKNFNIYPNNTPKPITKDLSLV